MGEQHAEIVEPAEAPQARERRGALDEVVAEIARDARRDPDAYARDSRVPEGGE
jgi:hypothetical protein